MGYLQEIIRNSSYKFVFERSSIEKLESKIIKLLKGNTSSYCINHLIRKKEIKLTPEEVVYQLYLS